MLARCLIAVLLAWTSVPAEAQTPPVDESAATQEGATAAAAAAASGQEAKPPVEPAAPVPEPPAPPTAEVPSLLPPPTREGGAEDEISLEQWQLDDWALVKPKTSLVELNGYYRLRADLLRKLDFDLQFPQNTGDTGDTGDTGGWEQKTRYLPASDGKADFTGANMRLRINPTINITDDIQIATTFDLLDNVILGSTADSTPAGGATPVNILSRSQLPPRNGVNAVSDSIVVRRLFGKVAALNQRLELRFGRMPDHWGLGMMTNDGDCLDCDYGDVVDQLAFTIKLAEHIFTPMYTFVSSGPVATPFGRSGGQPLDAVTWDDVEQYSLRVSHLDAPGMIEEWRLHDEPVLNYGLWLAVRRQYRDFDGEDYWSIAYNADLDRFDPAHPVAAGTKSVRRDGTIGTGDAFLKFYVSGWELGLEAALIFGQFKDKLVNPTLNANRATDILKMGGALEAMYRFDGEYEGTVLSFKTGGASGDGRAGFGALDQADSQRGATGNTDDLKLYNFQFSPDYHIDLLMFRQIIGAVTNAWYVRPEVSYEFDNDITGKAAVIYSQALRRPATPGRALPMGLEFDAELSYGLQAKGKQEDGLKAALAGGILFPFSAFRNLNLAQQDQGGSFAWTIQTRLYLNF